MMLRQLAGQIPGGVKWGSNGEGQIHCPYHTDKTASCSINTEKETFLCHGCGEKGTLRKLLIQCGITIPDVPTSHQAQAITYDYCDDKGKLIYQVVRTETASGKKFRQRRPDGVGGWTWKLDKIKRLPYRLPDLLKALAFDEPVLLVEGEKCVELLRSRKYTATCNSGGAGKWRKELNSYFPEDAKLFLIPDADVPGQEHMQKVGKALQARGCKVSWVDLGFPIKEKHGKDIADWIPSHTEKEFKAMIADAPVFVPSTETAPAEVLHGKGSVITGEFHKTDTGNAERLVSRYGDGIHHCDEWGKWLIWDGTRWAKDNMRVIRSFAKNTVRGMYAEGAKIEVEAERKALVRYALGCESIPRIRNMIEAATSEPGIPVRAEDLDKNTLLLNVENGTIDLTTGELQPHKQTNLITKLCPVGLDMDVECPRWTAFLNQIMDGNQDVIFYLQKAIGLSLTGDVSEDVFFFLHGGGENGKTTFLNTVHSLLGDYSCRSQIETFLSSKNNSIPNDLAALQGARFVSAVEAKKGRRFDEGRLKMLTGGDPIQARFMRAEYFEFMPQLKLWIAGNNKPVITDTTRGMWRRVRLIPFTVQIKEDKQDKHLEEKLKEELPGILLWALAGCLAWRQEGLGYPDVVKEATEEYRQEMDVLGDFISEKLVKDKAAKIQSSILYEQYLGYCEEAGEKRPWTLTKLAREMKERGFEKLRTEGSRFWIGIGLK